MDEKKTLKMFTTFMGTAQLVTKQINLCTYDQFGNLSKILENLITEIISIAR